MDEQTTREARAVLQSLIGQSLCYGLKSPDTDLYDFGFGVINEMTTRKNEKQMICAYSIHAICRFKIIGRTGEHEVNMYFEDTPSEHFQTDVQRMIGLCVKRVALSDKNDLWLDLGDYWIVFATYENGKESWRYLAFDKSHVHLVASNAWLWISKEK